MSRQGLNISREADSTTSLGSLGQGSVTLRVKKFFLEEFLSYMTWASFLQYILASMTAGEKYLDILVESQCNTDPRLPFYNQLLFEDHGGARMDKGTDIPTEKCI